jgi:hypothetical protein
MDLLLDTALLTDTLWIELNTASIKVEASACTHQAQLQAGPSFTFCFDNMQVHSLVELQAGRWSGLHVAVPQPVCVSHQHYIIAGSCGQLFSLTLLIIV